LAIAAGEGATLPVRLGGKLGPTSGDPLDVIATVTGVVRNATQSSSRGDPVPLGDAAALRVGGVDVVVIGRRTQTYNPDCFSNLGIDPAQKRILVVKSRQHFRARFAPIAAEI